MSAAGERGFTLLEMLVVLAILGLIGGLVWPSVSSGIASRSLRVAASGAQAALRSARARAIRSGRPTTIAPASFGRPPAGVGIAVLPVAGIGFFPDGSSTGGTVDVVGATGGFRYAVSRTGIVRPAR